MNIFFQRIPVKFPDVSLTDYCTFGLLKRALYKRKPTTVDFVEICGREMEINISGNFTKNPSIIEITM